MVIREQEHPSSGLSDNKKMLKVGICGASGFTGAMLLRILYKHSSVLISYLGSNSYNGSNVNALLNSDYENVPICFSSIDVDLINKKCDLIFLAMPHTASHPLLKNIKIPAIDLSADFRFNNNMLYEKWYGTVHSCPDKLKNRVYGLPELFRDRIVGSTLIANPGCYATSIILSIYPFVQGGLCSSAVADSASGVSGAGKALKKELLFYKVDENYKAYNIAAHKHQPEIEEAIGEKSGRKITLSFVPHLLPIRRGILSTIYMDNLNEIDKNEVALIIKNQYKNEPFIKVRDDPPQILDVVGTNDCHIYSTVDEHNGKIIVISAIDNMLKGASGQAVQNMNIAYGFDETEAIGGWLG